jgi:hypothetical protein
MLSQERLIDGPAGACIGLAEGETRWRGMTVECEMGYEASNRLTFVRDLRNE